MNQQEFVDRYEKLRLPTGCRMLILWHGGEYQGVHILIRQKLKDASAKGRSGKPILYGWEQVVSADWLDRSDTETIDRWIGWIFQRHAMAAVREWVVLPDGKPLIEDLQHWHTDCGYPKPYLTENDLPQ